MYKEPWSVWAAAYCSYLKPSDKGTSYALLMQSFALATARAERLAILAAIERASAMSWSV